MPKVLIDGREAEVAAGTNLVEAGLQVGVQIPHYCYHPRLSVVGQCRMCLVKIEGMPKLQTACTTQVMKDGMVVKVDDPEVKTGQAAIMEFLLINHPLDCPICDQAGECGLQDYSFKHGQAFSRFRFEEKRTYPAKERIPLGPHVLLNMNRCIQCTRCVRFTQEVSKTGELGFFERGARAEIGTFPGKPLDNPLSANVVDICPVGALTSTQFRFSERVWYLDKKPSLCIGCDVGCNITVEHRKGKVRRVKPRLNEAVNDHWMCDFGRGSLARYDAAPRLLAPRLRKSGEAQLVTWKEALDAVAQRLRARAGDAKTVFLSSAFLSTEEAYLVARLAALAASPHRALFVENGPARSIPNEHGGITGHEAAPNRRGVELAGLSAGPGGVSASQLLQGDAAKGCPLLIVADADLGLFADDPHAIARLRQADFLVVFGWADSALAQAADVALPTATHAERAGTFVNVQHRLQRFDAAFPSPGEARTGIEAFTDLLARFESGWAGLTAAQVFARLSETAPALAGLAFDRIPAGGLALAKSARPQPPATAAEAHP
jgi:NADH-quinone oxidoreductase subunit G